ncbi:MAG: PQQ-binding-like beta-propeller repeat protein [Verrucomicrobiota bacterium]
MRAKTLITALSLALFLAGALIPLSARTWTEAKSGRTLEAELVQVNADNVIVRRTDGQTLTLPFNILSEEDLAFIKEQGTTTTSPTTTSGGWPRWRGPTDHGSTPDDDHKYPKSLTEDDVAWKIETPGHGVSTPIVYHDKIILTAVDDEEDIVLAYSLDGELLWSTDVGDGRDGRHKNASGSNPSPSTDGEIIAVSFKSGNLAALDFEGKRLWDVNLIDKYGDIKMNWDFGTSPVIVGDLVVAAVMHAGESYVAAFDKNSGALKWKIDRTYPDFNESDNSYATPLVFKNTDGADALLIWGANHLTAYNAADGELLWSAADFNPDEERNRNWCAIATPVIIDDLAVIPFGRGKHLAGMKLHGEGDVTESNRTWTRDGSGEVPSLSAYDGKIYVLKNRGEVICVDPADGDTVWNDAFPRGSGSFFASPLVADGKLYAAREDGTVFVADIKNDFEVLSENALEEKIIASPVAIDGRLLIRGENHLYAYSAEN